MTMGVLCCNLECHAAPLVESNLRWAFTCRRRAMQTNQRGDGMSNENVPEYTITIEYDDFLTRFDLDEILSSIDRIIEDELLSEVDHKFRYWRLHHYPYPFLYREAPDLSYVGITAVDRGSITLIVLASSAVAIYVARRFKKGVDKSMLAEELERSGMLMGDVFGSALMRINDWADKYVPKQRELGGNVKKVTVKRRNKNDPQP